MSKNGYTREQIMAARRELKRRAASVALAPFVTYTFPRYSMGWCHEEICRKLDKFLDEVIAKKSPRLIMAMPPRSGKSEIVSRRFPAYVLGRYPELEVTATSYSGELSTSFSRDVQGIMSELPYKEVFDTRIPEKGVPSGNKVRRSDYFEVIGHSGKYRSVGVGGSLTGTGCHILLCDDLHKDRAEAQSQTIRQGVWDWFTSTAYTRVAPGGGIIVMMTRWHLDDIVGRLLEQEAQGGEHWEVINYPAIAEFDEEHRKQGEALHPERYPIEALERIRKSVGERDWNALYQQHPVPDGGGIFKKDWFRYWNKSNLPVSFDRVIMSWDMTFKDTSKSDYVVGQVWAAKGANYYLLDQVRGQWSFVKTKEMFIALVNKWPRALRKLIEDKANGPAVIAEFKEDITGIVPITPTDSKEARAHAVTTNWEAGNVYIPEKGIYPWTAEFETEVLSFPAAAHDDQVDCMTQALADLNKHQGFKVHAGNRNYLQMQGMLRR